MMSDPPCIAALRAQEDRDPDGVADAISKLSAIKPVIRCHRGDESAQHVTRSLASILARIFPEIHLDMHDTQFAQLVREDIRAAHPEATIGEDVESLPRVSVGGPADDAYFVDAGGWRLNVASPGQEQILVATDGGAHPASALLAAALVAARLLNDVPDLIEARTASGSTHINLWHPDPDVEGPTIPRALALDIHGFGHGSISNAAWGALEKWPSLRGQLVIIDPEAYEDHNAARYAFLPQQEVGSKKVDDLRGRLAHHHELQVAPRPERVQTWRKANDERPRLALICPDNRAARAWAADTQPLLAVAASASDREAQVALCNPEGGLCAYCLYASGHTSQTSHRDAIVAFTGIPLNDVIRLTKEWNGQQSEPLDEPGIRIMEATMGKSTGDFDRWIGKRLLEFLKVHQAELYSAARIKAKSADRIHMPLPIASAAAGAIALAGLLRMTVAGFKLSECEFNHLRLDVWTGELRYIREAPPESLTCLCQHSLRREWIA